MGAQTLAAADLPEAPMPFSGSALYASPMGGGVMLPAPPPQPRHHDGWRSPMALSLYALAAGETFDMIETHRTLSHPEWICGYSPQAGVAMMTAVDGDPLPASVSAVCGASPSGQIPNYAYEGTFRETGWTAGVGLASPRNFGAVLGWNLALDASGAVLPIAFRHRLSPRAMLMAELTNVAHAAAHFYGGMTNVNELNGSAGSPNTYFNGLKDGAQLNQLFPGPRWWGKR
jgi:hypothetical protein